MLQKLADNLWVAPAPQFFLRMNIGTRMTVVRLGDKGLLLHSPVPLTPEIRAGLSDLGEVRALVAPNCYHHLHIKSYIKAYPQAQAFAAPGLVKKRLDLRFHDVLGNEPPRVWEAEVEQILVRGMPSMNEVVFFHPASRTLILTDLSFNYPPAQSFLMRLYRQKVQDYDGKFAMARIIKLMVRDRKALRASCDQILLWDFDRVTVTHGEVLETGGKEAFREAVRWL